MRPSYNSRLDQFIALHPSLSYVSNGRAGARTLHQSWQERIQECDACGNNCVCLMTAITDGRELFWVGGECKKMLIHKGVLKEKIVKLEEVE